VRTPLRRTLAAVGTAAAMSLLGLPAASADHTYEPPAEGTGSAGDATITLPINDSAAGGTYYQPFQRVYAGQTTEGTDVYIYVPTSYDLGTSPAGVHSLDPAFDHDPDDDFVPCADASAEDFVLTQEQIDRLGDQLRDQIVRVDEEHFGPIGAADPTDPASDSLVTLVYNVQDDAYYDCGEDSYTAGYFAPDFIDTIGMNVIVLDASDWANRVGEDPSDAPWSDGDPANDRPELYEGVIAHELEHLLMNYSDPGELSWVDEGLADFAGFLNGYDITGSHLTYHQVFHRETSLTRWGGGLENYGASYTYFQYLWEQAGGNGDGTSTPDMEYDGVAGDLLLKMIFEEQLDGMEGVQAAIDDFNAQTGADLRSAEELFRDWAVAVYLDDEGSNLWDIKAADFGADSGGWTVDLANDEFYDQRGNYQGAQPPAKVARLKNRPAPNALPFGTSYESFRNPGPAVSFQFEGDPATQVAPHTGETHWWAGYESQSDNVLDVDAAISGGETVSFWNWHFIEEGWDYGFVEALVDGEWVTVPVTAADGTVVSTDDDPHGNNDGNGITGTSGGEYFVDEPEYVEYSAVLPDGATDVRFRYSTDAAYLDTGWFIDDVTVDGASAAVSSAEGEWVETDGAQDNQWTFQVVSACDLTPSGSTAGEIVDDQGNYVYRFTGDSITTTTFDTRCLKQDSLVVAISNLPTGDLAMLDATYDYSVVKQPGAPGKGGGKG
jgi:hypothetical protein